MADQLGTNDRVALENNDQIVGLFRMAFNGAAEIGEEAEFIPAEDALKEEAAAGEATPVDRDKQVLERQPGESDEKYKQHYIAFQGILEKDKENGEAEKAALLAQVEKAKQAAEAPKKKTDNPKALEYNLSEARSLVIVAERSCRHTHQSFPNKKCDPVCLPVLPWRTRHYAPLASLIPFSACTVLPNRCFIAWASSNVSVFIFLLNIGKNLSRLLKNRGYGGQTIGTNNEFIGQTKLQVSWY